MYLAQLHIGSQTTYQIRQSYRTTKNAIRYQTIYNFGEDPTTFVEPFSDHIVLFNKELLQAIKDHTERESDIILEQLLYRFLPEETQRRIDLFPPRSAWQKIPSPSKNEKNTHDHIHLFDRKRLYYLRYGTVDQEPTLSPP